MVANSSRLLRARDVAEILGICERSVFNLTEPHGPIRPVRLGRSIRYAPTTIQKFIDEQLAGNAAG